MRNYCIQQSGRRWCTFRTGFCNMVTDFFTSVIEIIMKLLIHDTKHEKGITKGTAASTESFQNLYLDCPVGGPKLSKLDTLLTFVVNTLHVLISSILKCFVISTV